jgi:hypothetical protein
MSCPAAQPRRAPVTNHTHINCRRSPTRSALGMTGELGAKDDGCGALRAGDDSCGVRASLQFVASN